MTRKTLRRALRRIYVVLFLLLAISFLAKIADHVPWLVPPGVEKILKDVYEFLRDMSLLIATGGVAYLTNLFQNRSSFVESLKNEWHDIVQAKSQLLRFMHNPAPTHAEYVDTYTRLSETIDNMRVVYRNVGETSALIGFYPYTPLHDMRRVLQTLDPRDPATANIDRKLARDTMLTSFYTLRERFLEELDLEEPTTPVLFAGARRQKTSGGATAAEAAKQRQIARVKPSDTDATAGERWLFELYEKEIDRNASQAAAPPSPIAS